MLSAGSLLRIIGQSGLCRTSTENRPSIAATDKRPLHSVSLALASVNTSIEYRDPTRMPTRPSRNTPVTSLYYARDSGYLGIDILHKPPAYGMRIDPAPSQPSILASGRLCPRQRGWWTARTVAPYWPGVKPGVYYVNTPYRGSYPYGPALILGLKHGLKPG